MPRRIGKGAAVAGIAASPAPRPGLRPTQSVSAPGTVPVPAISVPEESAGAADADRAAGAARADAALAGRAVPTAALAATGKTNTRPSKPGAASEGLGGR